jgi:hypothetical protein
MRTPSMRPWSPQLELAVLDIDVGPQAVADGRVVPS